jgi:hypothetical protein
MPALVPAALAPLQMGELGKDGESRGRINVGCFGLAHRCLVDVVKIFNVGDGHFCCGLLLLLLRDSAATAAAFAYCVGVACIVCRLCCRHDCGWCGKFQSRFGGK